MSNNDLIPLAEDIAGAILREFGIALYQDSYFRLRNTILRVLKEEEKKEEEDVPT